jgi:hypothetical protein
MCPVCRARFRGATTCSRCGADLTTLMSLAAHAWRLRQNARRSLDQGDLEKAHAFAAEAEAICHTPAGKELLELIALLFRPELRAVPASKFLIQ